MTMRYFGLGTTPEKKAVLSELKSILHGDDYRLKGLYNDLLLDENGNNTDALVNLRRMVDECYTNIFTKERTYIEKAKASDNSSKPETNTTSAKPQNLREHLLYIERNKCTKEVN